MSTPLGYAWIQARLNTPDFLAAQQARQAQVHSLQRLPEGALLVPARLKPEAVWLQQALFAIKHEGVRLDYLAAALRQISEEDMRVTFLGTPNGTYVRKLCFLWEAFHQRHITGLADPGISAGYVQMFDPKTYITGPSRRHSRWRVDFNGLGDLSFCPVIRKTPALESALARNVLAQASEFATSIGQKMLERALSWAYLSETEGSFAIEGETPTQDKTALFASLLQRAHDQRPLTEDYLVELQNATVTNPFDKAVQFRIEQNRLQNGSLGAIGVTYVPPPPDLSCELMDHLMVMANERPQDVDALVHAAAVSFAFVFIHPFMDGNGRLSRFLIHHCLGQSGQLPAGFLLPISVAMKKHEDQYLQALTAFSKPARALCDVTWAGDDHYSYAWKPDADIWFRYMDVTEGVTFTLNMAKAALDIHLRQEVSFLSLFDAVSKAINARYDLRGSDLTTLIVTAFQNGGKLSINRRKRFADRVQPHVLDAIEAYVSQHMQDMPAVEPKA
jgi:Fic family protein